MRLLFLLIAGFNLFFPSLAFSQEGTPDVKKAEEAIIEKTDTARKESVGAALNGIIADIEERKQLLAEKNKQLKSAQTDHDKAVLKAEIDTLANSLTEQEEAFIVLLAGEALLPKTDSKEKQPFDWKKDMLEILQPIMAELRALTENKRRIATLKNRIILHKKQIKIVSEALNKIDSIPQELLKKNTRQKLEQTRKEWQKQMEEHTHLLEVSNLQLAELQRKEETTKKDIQEEIKTFLSGRGGTLFIATGLSIATYIVLISFLKIVKSLPIPVGKSKFRTWKRLAEVLFQLFAVFSSVIALFFILNTRGDRVLTGIFVLLLLAIILVLQNSIPRYLDELKLMLDLGAVREGERIVYNGLPWQVANLNVYCKLINPAMEDFVVRVPLYNLAQLESRRVNVNEEWFPCTNKDWVVLGDGTYGQVVMISPESVIMTSAGSPLRLATTDFFNGKPKNLSRGFAVASVFGIDYKHQADCTNTIPQLMNEQLTARLKEQTYGSFLTKATVAFNAAGPSSLDYKIIATFEGGAADSWLVIQRDLQRLAVEICNEENWVIPFAQIVIHQAENSSAEQ